LSAIEFATEPRCRSGLASCHYCFVPRYRSDPGLKHSASGFAKAAETAGSARVACYRSTPAQWFGQWFACYRAILDQWFACCRASFALWFACPDQRIACCRANPDQSFAGFRVNPDRWFAYYRAIPAPCSDPAVSGRDQPGRDPSAVPGRRRRHVLPCRRRALCLRCGLHRRSCLHRARIRLGTHVSRTNPTIRMTSPVCRRRLRSLRPLASLEPTPFRRRQPGPLFQVGSWFSCCSVSSLVPFQSDPPQFDALG
jgi:hypothetical protein